MAAALMLAGVVSPVAAAPDKIAKAPPLPDLPTPGRALIGVEGDGCARLSAPKWKDKENVASAKIFVDVQPA